MNTLTKICRVCQTEKPLYDFPKDSKSKSGVRNDCKKCNCESRKKWQKENLDKVLIKNKLWIENNKERVVQWKNKYKHVMNEKHRTRYATDETFRNNRLQNAKNYRRNPKNKEIIYNTRKRLTDKYRNDPFWRIKSNLRRRLNFVIHGQRKSNTTEKLVGCSWTQLKEHIEKQFVNGMSWDNYGKNGWHIDHIIPCDKFDFSKPEEQSKCFHYSNLQPLWWYQNLEKSNK